jgi:hypothetical protein
LVSRLVAVARPNASASTLAAAEVKGRLVSIDFVDPVIDVFAGMLGGRIAGQIVAGPSAGGAGCTMVGAAAGLAAGLLLEDSVPFLTGQAGNPDLGELIGEFVAGALSGMLVAAIFAALMSKLTKV